MPDGELKHLQLRRYSIQPGGTIELDAATFEVQINPAEFKHTTSMRFDETKAMGQNANTPRYNAVGDERVEFSLVFDGTGVVPGAGTGQVLDVKSQLQQLGKVVYKNVPKVKEPPYVRLLWGTLIFFSRLDSMSTTYTLFAPSGEPLRAKVALAFRGATSQEELKLGYYTAPQEQPTMAYLRKGQTLEQLCLDKYGDAGYMETVARYNSLPNLFSVKEGQALRLPSKAQVQAMDKAEAESGAKGLLAQIRGVAQARAEARAKAR